jgi:hypothetical protein
MTEEVTVAEASQMPSILTGMITVEDIQLNPVYAPTLYISLESILVLSSNLPK